MFSTPLLKLQCSKEEAEYRERSIIIAFIIQLYHNHSFRFVDSGDRSNSFEAWARSFQLDLLLHGALKQKETGHKCMDLLHRILPVTNSDSTENKTTFALLLYQHVKSYENSQGVTVLPELLPVFHSVPPVWQISLADSRISALLDVLKVTGVKRPMEVGLSDDDTELGKLLVFLPFISQLRQVIKIYNR